MMLLLRLSCLVALVASVGPSWAGCPPSTSEDPCIAAFRGEQIPLSRLEEFARELPNTERCPAIADSGKWREYVCSELTKDIIGTSRALAMGYHHDPAYLRARTYFLNEYYSYAMLRDCVINKIDVSRPVLMEYYTAHRGDFVASPTVTLRLIRTRDEAKARTAMQRLQGGESFDRVENELSEVSPRQKGKVLGPYPSRVPTSEIPPNPVVIAAALATDQGKTTGPIVVGQYHFVVQTIDKTSGGQVPFEKAAAAIRDTIRERQGDELVRKMLAEVTAQVGVQLNEAAIGNPATRPQDTVATLGKTLLPYQEYTDLNGRVRGPATKVARFQQGKLAQFITPYLLAEAARLRGYADAPDLRKALEYYDLMHMGERIMDQALQATMTPPGEAEMRQHYEANRSDFIGKDGKPVSFELAREDIYEAMMMKRRQEAEPRHRKALLDEAGFEMCSEPSSLRITAYEALLATIASLPADARLLSISSDPVQTTGALEAMTLIGGGRRAKWYVNFATGGGDSKPQVVEARGPGKMSDGLQAAPEHPCFKPWKTKWLFDTDGLLRLAIDAGLVDFYAKYPGDVHLATQVTFLYENGSPSACEISYEVQPTSNGGMDSRKFTYSATSGQMIRED